MASEEHILEVEKELFASVKHFFQESIFSGLRVTYLESEGVRIYFEDDAQKVAVEKKLKGRGFSFTDGKGYIQVIR